MLVSSLGLSHLDLIFILRLRDQLLQVLATSSPLKQLQFEENFLPLNVFHRFFVFFLLMNLDIVLVDPLLSLLFQALYLSFFFILCFVDLFFGALFSFDYLVAEL